MVVLWRSSDLGGKQIWGVTRKSGELTIGDGEGVCKAGTALWTDGEVAMARHRCEETCAAGTVCISTKQS